MSDRSTWKIACEKADREYARKHDRPAELPDIPIVAQHGVPSAAALQREYERAIARREAERLPKSTLDAIDFLLEQNDTPRLEAFIAGRSQAEVAKILQYIAEKSS
jgi:hypothetical protein